MNDLVDETIRLKIKPNAFLYAIEATKIYLLALSFVFVIIPAHFIKGDAVPLYIWTRMALTFYFGTFLVIFVGMLVIAPGIAFIITNKRVVLHVSVMGAGDRISIPIDSIESIEVRSYNARYGSVYFECCETPDKILSSGYSDPSQPGSSHQSKDRPSRRASLTVKPGWAAIWFSAPYTRPPGCGFYGFKNFDAFARLIVEQQSAA
jgi:hypothetical protein